MKVLDFRIAKRIPIPDGRTQARALVTLPGVCARDYFPHGVHLQEYLARRRIGDIARQFAHQGIGSFESVACGPRAILRCKQPP